MGTLRHTRYQAAVLHERSILVVRCTFRDGPTVWILPGGGREEGEEEEACVVREVLEETQLHVRVDGLLFDHPAEPPDGTYTRWRTYLCSVVTGRAAPGGGEGANATLTDVAWIPIADQSRWPRDVLADAFLFPQLEAICRAVAAGIGLARS